MKLQQGQCFCQALRMQFLQQDFSLVYLHGFKKAIPITVTAVIGHQHRLVGWQYLPIKNDFVHGNKLNKKTPTLAAGVKYACHFYFLMHAQRCLL